jgi:hypothetical protein
VISKCKTFLGGGGFYLICHKFSRIIGRGGKGSGSTGRFEALFGPYLI